MKLNIKANSENGKIKSISGNEYISISLNLGNSKLYDIEFSEDGLVVQDGLGRAELLRHNTSKKQKDERRCHLCESIEKDKYCTNTSCYEYTRYE